MQGGKRAPSSWNLFVKKIYNEGKSKNSEYQFKDALKDASNRKSEMSSMSTSSVNTKKNKRMSKKSRSKSASVAAQFAGKRKTCKQRKH
jgi:hypothetical protein